MKALAQEAAALEEKLHISDVIFWYKGIWTCVPLNIMSLHKN